jgi:hypothetical protein
MEKFNDLLALRHVTAKQELVEMGMTVDEYLTGIIKKLKESE